jgi:hypothetical protein
MSKYIRELLAQYALGPRHEVGVFYRGIPVHEVIFQRIEDREAE